MEMAIFLCVRKPKDPGGLTEVLSLGFCDFKGECSSVCAKDLVYHHQIDLDTDTLLSVQEQTPATHIAIYTERSAMEVPTPARKHQDICLDDI